MSRWNGKLLGCLVLMLCLPPAWVRAEENEIVPAGAWLLRTGYGEDHLDASIGRDNADGPLTRFLIPEVGTRALIDGTVERKEQWWELLLGFGLSDTLNVHLQTAYHSVEQTSTLSTASTDATAKSEVARLESREVSGMGATILTGLYRPVYTDRSAIRLGLGVSVPGEGLVGPYAGRSTLSVGNPHTEYFAIFHNTTYFFLTRARIDIRLKFGMSEERELELASGGQGHVNPGSFGELFLGYEHNLGGFFYGLGAEVDQRGKAKINGVLQGDSVQNMFYRVQLGAGNLDDLEEGPLAFPYQFLLQWDQTVQGFNTPLHNTLRVLFKTYF